MDILIFVNLRQNDCVEPRSRYWLQVTKLLNLFLSSLDIRDNLHALLLVVTWKLYQVGWRPFFWTVEFGGTYMQILRLLIYDGWLFTFKYSFFSWTTIIILNYKLKKELYWKMLQIKSSKYFSLLHLFVRWQNKKKNIEWKYLNFSYVNPPNPALHRH